MILDDYITAHIDAESEHLSALQREAQVRLVRPRMIAGHLQGRVLKMLASIRPSQRILEIGAYTGYATLCLAEALPENGEIHTIEKNEEMEDFIRKQIDRSELKNKIQIHIGDALNIIPTLPGPFDLVYIDADKRQYCEYYDLVFDKVNTGGLILADNTLWNQKVLQTPHPADRQTLGIQNFNKKIKHDPRIQKVILPLRDGLTICLKL